MDLSTRKHRLTWPLIVITLLCGAIASGQAGFASPPLDVSSKGETHLSAPEDTFKGAPAYDSGWYDLGIRPDPLSVLFTHNVGGNPDDYVVHLECKEEVSLGTYDCTDLALNVNAHWYALTDTTVSVWAGSARPDEVRVRIYDIAPAYDSGWDELLVRPDEIPVEFTHSLGRDVVIHMVSLECKDDSSLGTYDCINHAFNIDADWYGLNGTTVNAWVAAGSRPDEVRIRLFTAIADYSSGWQTIGIRPDPLPMDFTHDLGGNPDDYFVILECADNTSLGVYNCTNFLFNKQASWYGLTDTKVTVWIAGGDSPDEVRVRILTPNKVFLPMVMRHLCP